MTSRWVMVSPERVMLSVPGMTCGHCESAVKEEIGDIAGVTSVDVDLHSKDVLVAGHDLDIAALVAAVGEAGYEAAVR